MPRSKGIIKVFCQKTPWWSPRLLRKYCVCHCVWQCFSDRFMFRLLGGVDLVSSLDPHLDLIIVAVLKASADYYALPDRLLPSSSPWIITHLCPWLFITWSLVCSQNLRHRLQSHSDLPASLPTHLDLWNRILSLTLTWTNTVLPSLSWHASICNQSFCLPALNLPNHVSIMNCFLEPCCIIISMTPKCLESVFTVIDPCSSSYL